MKPLKALWSMVRVWKLMLANNSQTVGRNLDRIVSITLVVSFLTV